MDFYALAPNKEEVFAEARKLRESALSAPNGPRNRQNWEIWNPPLTRAQNRRFLTMELNPGRAYEDVFLFLVEIEFPRQPGPVDLRHACPGRFARH